MSKAFDKIAAGLNDIIEGNYTVHQPIPDDIKKAAAKVYKDLLTTCERWSDADAAEDIPAIARALLAERLAERERCAKVADKHATGGCACEGYGCTCGNYDDAGAAGGAATAKHIATAIRSKDHG